MASVSAVVAASPYPPPRSRETILISGCSESQACTVAVGAIAATVPDRIQGFSYGPSYGAPHVVRDVTLPRDQQELWRGDSHSEMLERCAIEEMRVALAAAAAAASPSPSKAEG
jgi:hypothetical protein